MRRAAWELFMLLSWVPISVFLGPSEVINIFGSALNIRQRFYPLLTAQSIPMGLHFSNTQVIFIKLQILLNLPQEGLCLCFTTGDFSHLLPFPLKWIQSSFFVIQPNPSPKSS